MKEVVDFALKKAIKLGADDAITSCSISNMRQIKFVDNQIVINQSWIDKSAAILVVKDKKLAITTIRDYSKPAIEKTVKKLMRFTKFLQPNPDYYGIAKGKYKYKKIKYLYDKKIGSIEEKSVDIVESAINSSLSEGAKRASGVLNFGTSESCFRTSNELGGDDKSSLISLSIRALLNERASGHQVTSGRVLRDFKPEEAGSDAGKTAAMAANPRKIGAGVYDIIFDHLPFAVMINSIIGSASSTAVETGLSFLSGKLGKKVASEKFTLLDDGQLPGGLSSSSFDAEGMPTQTTKVINKGILKTYLHNTSTAKKNNTKSTANAGIISPEPTNAVVEPGNSNLQKMIENTKKGLYITNTWYTRFHNFVTGEFSTLPRDGIFEIENGEIKHPTIGVRLSDNMIQLMENISEVGKKRKQIVGWEISIPATVPVIKVDKMHITKSILKKPVVS